ncbi:MAG: hypothetical protein M1837_005902 [Sclerophora amabilis]|nr:MAG: hypothetical protein M1837_005902 [Sclerophora amabilis]
MPFELYACGFNAHGQLAGASSEEPPQDLSCVQFMLRANHIRILFAGWADTLLEIDGRLLLRGASTNGQDEILQCDISSPTWRTAFGDHNGVRGLVTEEDDVYLVETAYAGPPTLRKIKSGTQNVSIAGNGKVCEAVGAKSSAQCHILEYPTFAAFSDPLTNSTLRHTLPLTPTALISNETSFTALFHSSPTTPSAVYTWGDPRHTSLGRLPSASQPAASPHPIDHLGGINLRKVCSGGWISAALSDSDDLYIWGGRAGEEHRIQALPDVGSGEVTLVDLQGDDGGMVDVVDVAVGAGHVLLLDGDGSVWGAGRNENGQLDRGAGRQRFLEDWTRLDLNFDQKDKTGAKRKVEGVHCGAWNSFVLVSLC